MKPDQARPVDDVWDPELYQRFAAERAQPFFDLLELVQPQPAMKIVDLGCGTGALTRELHRRLRPQLTLGIDRSAAMLAEAARIDEPGLRFAAGTIEQLASEPRWDLIFANASLHWVDDHPTAIARLGRALAPGGQLAVQVPANHDHPSHVVAAEVAAEPPFAAALAGWTWSSPVLEPTAYARTLHGCGFAAQTVRLQVYVHHLPSRDSVVQWVAGTLLTSYQQRLTAELFALFLARYRERLLPELEDGQPFFYPFKRLLLWGRLPASAPSEALRF